MILYYLPLLSLKCDRPIFIVQQNNDFIYTILVLTEQAAMNTNVRLMSEKQVKL